MKIERVREPNDDIWENPMNVLKERAPLVMCFNLRWVLFERAFDFAPDYESIAHFLAAFLKNGCPNESLYTSLQDKAIIYAPTAYKRFIKYNSRNVDIPKSVWRNLEKNLPSDISADFSLKNPKNNDEIFAIESYCICCLMLARRVIAGTCHASVLLDKFKLKKITLSYILHNHPKLFGTACSKVCSFFIGNGDMFDKCYVIMKKHYFDDILKTIEM